LLAGTIHEIRDKLEQLPQFDGVRGSKWRRVTRNRAGNAQPGVDHNFGNCYHRSRRKSLGGTSSPSPFSEGLAA
jgi:hypothetical protein